MTSRSFAKLQLLLITLGILAFLFPWSFHSSSGLSLNAYDLAHWSTRHAVEFSEPLVMFTSFLIRGQLLILAAIVARLTLKSRWLFCLILFIALLPPLDGFLREPGNPNYRQLALLALATALVSIVGPRMNKRLINESHFVLPMIGLASCIYATIRVSNLFVSMKLDHMTGYGLMMLLSTYLLLLITAMISWRQKSSIFRKPYVRLHS